jgi:glutamine synthetase
LHAPDDHYDWRAFEAELGAPFPLTQMARHYCNHAVFRSRHVCDAGPGEPDPSAVEAGARLARRRLHINGKPLEHAPRQVLKRQLAAAGAAGYRLKTGVEAEFFLLRPDGRAVGDGEDRQAKPCYDQTRAAASLRADPAISDAMLGLGWGPYQSDHEDANG